MTLDRQTFEQAWFASIHEGGRIFAPLLPTGAEITNVTPIAGRVNTPTLAHLYRGETFMQQREWKKAISEFSRANGDSQRPMWEAFDEGTPAAPSK